MIPMLKVLEVALGEDGYLEKSYEAYRKNPLIVFEKTAGAGHDNYTKYMYELDRIKGWYNGPKNGYAWCSGFSEWCFIAAYGIDAAKEILCHSIYSAGVNADADNYRRAGRLFFNNPQIGDRIYFGKSSADLEHVGLIHDLDNYYIYTVEGNTSSASGVVPNGGAVCRKRYSRNDKKVICFGRPNYSVIDEEDLDMTQEKFDEFMDNWLARRRELPESAWSVKEGAWAKATKEGVVNGQAPQSFITRQEVTAIMDRRGLLD